ncbi:MAG: LLM class flavin-dependent oxidoreductase [Alphaproteobacteria bacterium]
MSMFSVIDHYPSLPRSTKQFYNEILDQCELADTLGYNTFFVAEHHFHEYGAFPNPAVALSAAAMRTKRIKLGTAVVVLPFRNPIQVAEDYAMVDQLSDGRLVMGVGSGYLAHEFEGFGIDPRVKRESFDEAIDIIRRLWSGDKISYDGKFTKIDNAAINVLPVQQPSPKTYVAALRAETVYYVGKNGDHMMIVPYATVDEIEGMGPLVDSYQKGFAESGKGGKGEVVGAFHAYVAETDDQARADAADAFNLYVETRKYAKSQVYDECASSKVCVFGSVETAVERLVQMYELGVTHVALMTNFGGLSHDLVCDSMRRIATEVAPEVTARLRARAAA